MDSHKKTIIKTISYRVISTSVLMLFVWLYTGELLLSLSAGAIEFVTKSVIFYVHERVWARFKF